MRINFDWTEQALCIHYKIVFQNIITCLLYQMTEGCNILIQLPAPDRKPKWFHYLLSYVKMMHRYIGPHIHTNFLTIKVSDLSSHHPLWSDKHICTGNKTLGPCLVALIGWDVLVIQPNISFGSLFSSPVYIAGPKNNQAICLVMGSGLPGLICYLLQLLFKIDGMIGNIGLQIKCYHILGDPIPATKWVVGL